MHFAALQGGGPAEWLKKSGSEKVARPSTTFDLRHETKALTVPDSWKR